MADSSGPSTRRRADGARRAAQVDDAQRWHNARSGQGGRLHACAERGHPYVFSSTAGATIPPHLLGRALAAMHTALVCACALTFLLVVLQALREREADLCAGASLR